MFLPLGVQNPTVQLVLLVVRPTCAYGLKQPGGHMSDQDKWEFYKDAQGEWRWRRIASNGRVVGASSQGYKNQADCIDNARRNGYRV